MSEDRPTGADPSAATAADPLATMASGRAGKVPLLSTGEFAADRLPGYVLDRVIGTGACGVVYKAKQLTLDRVVAVKMVAVGTAGPVARFEREAIALAKLQHPNIVQVYDSGHAGGQMFFAMELLAGEDLEARLEREERLPEPVAWGVARQAAAALDHAAGHGIYHRDVKPANLFLVPPPTGFTLPAGHPMVKVMDFGLALVRPADLPASEPTSDPRLTQAGMVVGTPVYMAPEQFVTPDADRRSDIYALGATVYHALTGAIPFPGATVAEVLARKAGPPPRPGPPVSPASADLLAAMMDPDPDRRIGSYDELIARIDRLSLAPAPAPPRRRWRWAAAAGLAAVLAAVVGVIAFRGPGRGRPADVEYEATDSGETLYVPGSVLHWVPDGGEVGFDEDEEGAKVLLVTGRVGRRFSPYAAYRVTVALDLYKAAAAEVAIPTGYAVRVSRADGVAVGRAAGGRFEPVGPAVPFPTGRAGGSPYLPVSWERAGGRWVGWLGTQRLGDVPDDGRPAAELRVRADTGSVRIESAQVEELRPKG